MSNVGSDSPDLAENYDRVSNSQFEKGLMLADRMGIGEGAFILDIGCGTGRLALYLSKAVGPSGRIDGIDPSPHRIDIANNHLKDLPFHNVHFSIGNAEDLGSFSDGAFDHAYYSSVFHWVGDKKLALREAYRVLKPGGKVGMTTIDRDNLRSVRAIAIKILSRPPYAGQIIRGNSASKPVGKGELEILLADAGFQDIVVEVISNKRYYQSPKKLLEFYEASSFGNFLGAVPDDLRPALRQDIEDELEKRRTNAGIELLSNMIFAIATKPS